MRFFWYFLFTKLILGLSQSVGLAQTAEQNPTTCPELADQALSTQPRILAAKARVQALQRQAATERSLPAPRLSFELWDFPIGAPSRADSEGMYMVGLGQEFVSPRARRSAERAGKFEADAALDAKTWTTQLLKAELAHACVNWSAAELIRDRLKTHQTTVNDLREAMLARYRSGSDSLGMLARSEAELAIADRHIAEAEVNLQTERNVLAAYLGEDFPLPETPPALNAEKDSPQVDELASDPWQGRPDLQEARAKVDASKQRSKAARVEARVPNFDTQATYMKTPNERTGLGAYLSVSLPWLARGGRAQKDRAQFEQEAAQQELKDSERMASIEVNRALGRVKRLATSLKILQEQQLPALQRGVDADRSSIRSSGFDLRFWIESVHALVEGRVEEAQLQAELEHAQIDFQTQLGKFDKASVEKKP